MKKTTTRSMSSSPGVAVCVYRSSNFILALFVAAAPLTATAAWDRVDLQTCSRDQQPETLGVSLVQGRIATGRAAPELQHQLLERATSGSGTTTTLDFFIANKWRSLWYGSEEGPKEEEIKAHRKEESVKAHREEIHKPRPAPHRKAAAPSQGSARASYCPALPSKAEEDVQGDAMVGGFSEPVLASHGDVAFEELLKKSDVVAVVEKEKGLSNVVVCFYRTQVVAGVNYLLTLCGGSGKCYNVKVFDPLPGKKESPQVETESITAYVET